MQATRALRAAKKSLTGFDPKAFIVAGRQAVNDPWQRRESWRYEGDFTRWNRFKGAFPGLGIATVAFTGYCVYEHFFLTDSDHGHAAAGH